jgi:hypothetical protein
MSELLKRNASLQQPNTRQFAPGGSLYRQCTPLVMSLLNGGWYGRSRVVVTYTYTAVSRSYALASAERACARERCALYAAVFVRFLRTHGSAHVTVLLLSSRSVPADQHRSILRSILADLPDDRGPTREPASGLLSAAGAHSKRTRSSAPAFCAVGGDKLDTGG